MTVTTGPSFLVLFAPDTLENRIATAVIAVKYGGTKGLCDLGRRQVEAPIVMLPAPGDGDRLSPELGTAYGVIINSLRAVAEGAATDMTRGIKRPMAIAGRRACARRYA